MPDWRRLEEGGLCPIGERGERGFLSNSDGSAGARLGQDPIELRTLQSEFWGFNLDNIIRVETHSSLFDFFLAATAGPASSNDQFCSHSKNLTRFLRGQVWPGLAPASQTVSLGLLDWWPGDHPHLATGLREVRMRGLTFINKLPSQPQHDLLNHCPL